MVSPRTLDSGHPTGGGDKYHLLHQRYQVVMAEDGSPMLEQKVNIALKAIGLFD